MLCFSQQVKETVYNALEVLVWEDFKTDAVQSLCLTNLIAFIFNIKLTDKRQV